MTELLPPLDLTSSNKDYAVFLPSISSIYVKFLSSENTGKRGALPPGLKRSWDDLDFLKTNGDLYNYKWALYSAGHARHDPAESDVVERMVQKRDRPNTVILGDSGGFQIATGVLKWPWEPKKGQDETQWRGDQDTIRMGILRWLEHTADWSMIFDFPPGGLTKYGFDPTTGASLHPGLKSYRDCLMGSIDNAKFFLKYRKPGATKFLNVLQGRNLEEGDEWFNLVKDWEFESWAFADIQSHNLALNLRRIIHMRDGGYLSPGHDWLHYLGNGKIKAATNLTTIQRCLRKHVNPNVTLSYDAASPFVMTAKGQIYVNYMLNQEQMAFKSGPIPDNKAFKGSKTLLCDYVSEQMKNQSLASKQGTAFDSLFALDAEDREVFIESRISKKITLGDICVKGYEDVTPKIISKSPEAHQQELGFLEYDSFEEHVKKYPSALDGLSYVLCMNHNVELHIRGCQEACDWLSQPHSIARQHLPADVLEFRDLCEDIFTTEKPMTLIEKNWTMLTNGTGMTADNSISLALDKFQQ